MVKFKALMTNTPGGKLGGIEGLNLFFGALLGANLGTIGAMPLYDYVKLIVLLAATVMVIRMISTSERRLYMMSMVALYAAILTGVVMLPSLHPKGMSDEDLHRLVATLAIWMILVLASELAPVAKPEPAVEGDAAAGRKRSSP
jgi:hypothetical protein